MKNSFVCYWSWLLTVDQPHLISKDAWDTSQLDQQAIQCKQQLTCTTCNLRNRDQLKDHVYKRIISLSYCKSQQKLKDLVHQYSYLVQCECTEKYMEVLLLIVTKQKHCYLKNFKH